MYGFAKGVGPSRDVAGSQANAEKSGPPMSGMYAPQNSLTSDGPTQEPSDVNALPDPQADMRKRMAMAMMVQQMGKMSQPGQMPGQSQRQALDIYGQPV